MRKLLIVFMMVLSLTALASGCRKIANEAYARESVSESTNNSVRIADRFIGRTVNGLLLSDYINMFAVPVCVCVEFALISCGIAAGKAIRKRAGRRK